MKLHLTFLCFALICSSSVRADEFSRMASQCSEIYNLKRTTEPARKPDGLTEFCKSLLGSKVDFDTQLFQKTLVDLRSKEPSTKEELADFIRVPEKLLAVVEHIAQTKISGLSQDALKRYSLSMRLASLSKQDLNRLKKRLGRKTNKAELTSDELAQLSIYLYRSGLKNLGLFKTVWYEKSVFEAFDRLDDQFV